MSNLVLFQKHLLAQDVQGVQEFLAGCDQRSANEGIKQAGEAFGFPTAEIEGVRYMLARDLARTVYGYENASPLKRLLARYGRKLLDFQGFDHDGQSLIRQAFSLSPRDFSSTLATWGDLLIVGMKGDTEAAKKIMAYLLEAEEKARVSQACEAITGLSPRQLSIAENDDPIIRSLLQTQQTTQALIQLRARQLEAEKVLSAQAQALSHHDQALADQGKRIRAIAASQEEDLQVTPEQEKTLCNLMERLISARAAARSLPASEVAPPLWNWIKRSLGIRTFRSISRAQYPMALDKLQSQLVREEAALGQGTLRLVKKPESTKDKGPWADL